MKSPSIFDRNSISGQLKYASVISIAKLAETNLRDDFFTLLAEKLMLDEILCGECNAVEFLKNEVISTHKILQQIGKEK